MGVVYYGVCHDCKEWIDAGKCPEAVAFVRKAQSRNPPLGRGMGMLDKGFRILWFAIAHGGHNVDTTSDHEEGGPWEQIGRYREVFPYDHP